MRLHKSNTDDLCVQVEREIEISHVQNAICEDIKLE